MRRKFGNRNVSSQQNKPKVRKIYLTVDINVNGAFFKEMTGFKKLNLGKLLMDTDYKDVGYDKGKIVADTIFKPQADMLIGYAIQTPKDIESLLKNTGSNVLLIRKVYLSHRNR